MKVDVEAWMVIMVTIATSLLTMVSPPVVASDDEDASRQRLDDLIDRCFNSDYYYYYDVGLVCSADEYLGTDCSCAKCIDCPAGTRMSERCGSGIGHSAITCVLCGVNEYSDHLSPPGDWRHTCAKCDICSALGREEIAPCVRHSNAQCSTNCKPGCTAPHDDSTDRPQRPTQCVCQAKDTQILPEVETSTPEAEKGPAKASNTTQSVNGAAGVDNGNTNINGNIDAKNNRTSQTNRNRTLDMKTGGARDGTAKSGGVTIYVATIVGLALLVIIIPVAIASWRCRAEILSKICQMGQYRVQKVEEDIENIELEEYRRNEEMGEAEPAVVEAGGGEVKIEFDFNGPPAIDESAKAVPPGVPRKELDVEDVEEDSAPPATDHSQNGPEDNEDEGGAHPTQSTPLVGGLQQTDRHNAQVRRSASEEGEEELSDSDSELGAVGGRAAPVRRVRPSRRRGQQPQNRDRQGEGRGYLSRIHRGHDLSNIHRGNGWRRPGNQAANHRGNGGQQQNIDRGRRGPQAPNFPPNAQNHGYMPVLQHNGPVVLAMPSSQLDPDPSHDGEMASPQKADENR